MRASDHKSACLRTKDRADLEHGRPEICSGRKRRDARGGLRNVKTRKELAVACVFIAIGHDPNTGRSGKLDTDPMDTLTKKSRKKHLACS
jgi:thioredoxin reductase